jgi:hypothetical protein
MPYSGRCRGGPWDGKDLFSEWRTYRVPIAPQISAFVDPRSAVESPPDYVKLTYGFYEHCLGQWVWHADS